MQGNRDGSWSLPSSGNGGSGRGNVNNNTVPSGYLPPQANSLFSNFNQPIRYPLTQYTPNLYSRIFPDFSLGSPNFQPQQNLNFHHQQIPHQFSNNANVFLQSHGPSSFSFPPQCIPNHDISIYQNSEAFESSSLKRRREEVDLVLKETPISSFVPGESANESGVSRIHGGKGSSDKSSSKSKRKVELQRIDKAVNKTRESIIAAGESVSSTRVTQLVLEQLQADSWRSLGVQMQDVPSLRQLMALEGKINAFIHCFVGARRIVTLHDLELAICRTEFVESFDDLELGPLLQHPLVLLYFPSISSSTGPVQITSEEIISFLDSYLHTYMTEDVKLDEFLNFVASQKSVTSKEKLGVRIQSLRMYVSFILDAKRQEGETLKFLLTELHQKYHIPSSKKQRQDKSLTVSERADSFALRHKDYCGKHTRFNASSSDDNDSDDNEVENLNSSDHINSCPYPSVAEEMKRLGGSNKKRKGERRNHEKSDSSKLPRKSPSKLRGHKKQEIPKLADDSDAKKVFGVNETDFTLSEGDLRLFISTWKDTCKELSISTFVEKMLSFYNSGGSEGRAQMKRAKAMSSLPFVGLLNVAVTSMRRGMCDSIYDSLQMTSQSDTTNIGSGNQVGEIKPSENSELSKTQHVMPPKHSNTVEEIMRRLSLYFEHDLCGGKHISIFRKLQTCEVLLAEQFQVHDFESLGWGGFFTFLEKHMLLLPTQLQRFLARELREEFPLEVHVNENLLTLLLSQASEFSGGNVISRQMVARLLAEQFPSIDFKVVGKDSEENFTEIIGKKKSGSKCVLFSATLLGAVNSLNGKNLEEPLTVTNDTESRSCPLSAVSSKEVLDVLLRVPLLSDLNSCCHWDLRFAPSFGPLMGCLNEINSKDLLCLVTRDGKVLRIDPSATADSFLEAALQGSAYRTAAQLLSLISLNGRTHLPFSLLQCYAKRAFEVFFNNHSEKMELNDRNSLVHMRGPVKFNACLDNMIAVEQKTKMDETDYASSKFLLDCLGYLPGEFRSLAVDVLLSGLRSVVKDAPTRLLSACDHTEQRIMLHDAGLLLGIVEWINDYHKFCSSFSANSALEENASSNLDSGVGFVQQELEDPMHTEQGSMIISEKSCEDNKEPHESCHTFDGAGALCDSVGEAFSQTAPDFHDNPASVIDLIRQDEFGLNSSSSGAEMSMLQKQHARLGRALQCLSQELYSQDSHFILELVQNADDNKYPEHVEPTLTFILQKTGIVVLNNECGFMPENIRALCDVGQSTKKGSGGYIGKKGIGFKSVFRVSDAPEIHSNGFHFKFDISEGQIGYILPTVVPPHDIESLTSMLSGHALQPKDAKWNTCITLPFRTIDSERTTVNHIEPMFSDLHPSLLLFLHRLQCIVYRNMLDNSLLVMRKEVMSKNIVKVSCGENSMTWFVASEKLKAAIIRDGAQITEISIGFTLDMLEDGTYRSCMIQEPVFAFLPLRTYGLKFIIQGDFILTSSREDVDEDSPWNQWLLSEFPGLFVGALRSFCSLPSFTQNLGKAVSSYLQLVPLVGEVHGFFSSLPRSILSRLRTTNCLLLEGEGEHWVPPCKVLRNWNEKIRVLLKDGLLHEHLALGFLNKDIILSDSLSRALGIEDYGPKTLVQILSSLSLKKDCLQSMGYTWLSSILTELCLQIRSSGHGNVELGVDKTLLDSLHKIPFIPLSNGMFTSLDEGAVWLHHDTTGFDLGDVIEAFPMLYGNLRTIDHSLLLASSVDEKFVVDDVVNMLCAIGVQKLSAHEIIKVHILPAFEARSGDTPEGLMVDYLCFVMTHLRSGCHICHNERKYIISELRSKALILSNYGLKQLGEASIHFSEEFGNQVNIKTLTKNVDTLWHVVDGIYLKHPASKYYACGLKEWRDFFQEIGIADFAQVVQVEKSIAEFYSVSPCEKYDINLLSPELTVSDWESPELVDLLSLLHKSNGRKGCKYLLEVLDRLWDDCYHDKTTVNYNSGTSGVIRSSESSFMRVICDSQWIVSSMDNKLHLAKDLYHDCDDVQSILGMNAPYAVPKVTSVKLLNDIGFKTKVCLDDALEILEAWAQCGDSFKSSISQMTRFYKFLWNEMADSKQKINEKLHTFPSVFVPHEIGSRQNDLISGIFLSLDDVYWNDSAGVLDGIKEISSQISSVVESLHRKTLCNIYPGLQDFFVNGCGVPETPSFQEYLKILGQFAHYVSPSCAAKAVFKIFLKWSDDLKSGKSSEDVGLFKEKLSELEYTVLPTENDKWVSLHSSFGLVCWCDDEKLKKRFRTKDNIHFIYFGENADEEQEVLQTKVSGLMHSLGIPSISEVVKREARYEGLQDNSVTVALVNWALPYAQRYIFTLHHEKYTQTRKTVHSQVKRLQVFVVQKLCYRNVIPQYGISSKKEFKCSSLLQDKALYTTPDLDSHSMFMELSRLFFNGVPDLHLANFLHLIKTMAESGMSEEQLESFILNSQNIHQIPDGEKIWSLKSAIKAKKKAGISLSWLPSSSKTGHNSKEELASSQISSSEENVTETLKEQIPIEITGYDNSAGTSSRASEPNPLHSMHMQIASTSGNQAININPNLHEWNNSFSAHFSERDQLHTGTPWAVQAQQTGKKGEEIAYRYFAAKYGKEALVRWVNEQSETGLPYDLMIENRGGKKEYVEVKATVSTRKDFFNLTVREWQFANEKGESYIIAHVLLGNSNAIITQHRNPVKLCQEGHLRLLVLMPNQRNEVNVAF
ncbi:Protein NO VEIN [Cardamine amara subsp. amara]|uniref:Protein NO VEIN n=1 Tax=Cardamine amara subsp. amara TaxID=228776 RepID=A0ABD1AVK2_CARAN